MQFFIRKYSKGKRGSGTQDIWVSESPLSTADFKSICKVEGCGKYLLCVRGKGIRGFKKLDEYVLSEVEEVFEAETISVKKNVDVSLLSSEEILDIMGSMITQAPQTPDGQAKFMADLQTFHSELSSRNQVPEVQTHESENTIVSAGFPIGSAMTSFVLGAVTGGVVIWLVQRKTINDLKSQIDGLEESVKEAEEAIKSVKRQAEKIEKKADMSFDQKFMSQFNAMNGWRQ